MTTTYVSGKYKSGEHRRTVKAVEDWLTNEFLTHGPIAIPEYQRDINARLMDVSHGKNLVRFDGLGNPSVMVKFAAKRNAELGFTGDQVHPAFIVNGNVKDFEMGKYPASTIGSGAETRAVTLRGMDPRGSITFDASLAACKVKGPGFHLATNAEWAAVSLLAVENGFIPRGNTSFGKAYDKTSEWGDVSYRYKSAEVFLNGRTKGGSGPVTWAHDGTDTGVYDLVGNVREWTSGFRTVDGEIQVLADNNAADNSKDQTLNSLEWKAIMPDGTLVAPGTAGTLKYTTNAIADVVTSNILVGTERGFPLDVGYGTMAYEAIKAVEGVAIPDLLKQLLLFPHKATLGRGIVYTRNSGERLGARGGYWSLTSLAGLFYLNANNPRAYSVHEIGFRESFVEL